MTPLTYDHWHMTMRLVDAVHIRTIQISLWSLCFCFPEHYDGEYSTEFRGLICVCIFSYCKLFCVFFCPTYLVRGEGRDKTGDKRKRKAVALEKKKNNTATWNWSNCVNQSMQSWQVMCRICLIILPYDMVVGPEPCHMLGSVLFWIVTYCSFCYDHIQGVLGGICHTLEEHFLG